MIDQIMDMFRIPEAEATKAFEAGDFNFDNAVEYIVKQRDRVNEEKQKQK